MPFYIFKDSNTNEVFEIQLKLSEYDDFIKSHPTCSRYYEPDSMPGVVSGVGGIKNDAGWKEVLSKVAEKHPNSALGNKMNRKSIKQVKTENIIKKHTKNRV